MIYVMQEDGGAWVLDSKLEDERFLMARVKGVELGGFMS
jgi:hypothetical protein